MRGLDPAFERAGQKDGLEIWRIENFRPVILPVSSHGQFFTGDAYVVLKTTVLRNGAFRHDIHYWLGTDTSQAEAGEAAIKSVELDTSLGGRAVQYREIQGHETDQFLSYFKPCIIPQRGGVTSGFKCTKVHEHEHDLHLYVCKGKHVLRVKEVTFSRASLTHDDIFILDTKFTIFQFNGSNSSNQERAKALEVVQYIKDTKHDGKCEVAAVDDGKLIADAKAGEFWAFFGGFAPLPRKTVSSYNRNTAVVPPQLLCVNKGQSVPVEADCLTREMLNTNKCYLLDCAFEFFVWMGRNTSLEERKSASTHAEEIISGRDRPEVHTIRVIEGFETVMFRSKFEIWPLRTEVSVCEDGRGKVAALLKRQGLSVKGIVKATSVAVKEESLPYIDCTGNLQVWRVNGREKTLLQSAYPSKFYSGDCYIFQYTYPGENKDENLVGTWFGRKSVEEEKSASISLATKMVESLKYQAVQARFYEGREPVQFFSIFQSFFVFKGGVSSGYKKFVSDNTISDETYAEDGVALFRVQGSGPDNMQAIQVELVASSLNSSYCYILHRGNIVFTWSGNLTSSVDQDLVERQLDVLKPNVQSKPHREGAETEQFWALLGGKDGYPIQKNIKEQEKDPHLFSCTFSKSENFNILKVAEIYNFVQDDLMTEDIFILNSHSEVFIWVGRLVDSKSKLQALTIGQKFLEHDFLMEKLSLETPLFIVSEGNEPPFFTRFFTWDSGKSSMHGNSFERKLAILKNGVTPKIDKPKRRTTSLYGGRSSVPDNSQRSRSVPFSPDRVRGRGRSPQFNALAAKFENQDTRNLSTPPPAVRKLHPKSVTPDSARLVPRSTAIASLTYSFEATKRSIIPKIPIVSSEANKPKPELNDKDTSSISTEMGSLTVHEDLKKLEAEDKRLPIYPYERLNLSSYDPVAEIDVTRRETYLSSVEFKEKFGMTKETFYMLPKWKQDKLKMVLQLF